MPVSLRPSVSLHLLFALLRGLALLVLLSPSSWGAEIFQSYHIGNSLTWDMQVGSFAGHPTPQFDGAVAAYHIRCSQNLTYMLENPTDTCVDPTSYGYFGEALPNHRWDAVTLQPYVGATGGEELAAAGTMIQLTQQQAANGATRFYIHATWPQAPEPNGSPEIDFPALWLAKSEAYSDSTEMIHEQAWYEWYAQELRQDFPDTEIYLNPVGDVLLALDAKFRGGAYDGISDVSDLYRDRRHLNNVGRYVAQMTGWATMHRTSPESLPWNEGFSITSSGTHGRDLPRSEELSELIRSTVWEVLTEHEFAGVIDPHVLAGDYNNDGVVDAADYTVWRDSMGTTAAGSLADGIRNGVIDSADYDHWRAHFGNRTTTIPTSANAVPEPCPFSLLLLSLILALPRFTSRQTPAR